MNYPPQARRLFNTHEITRLSVSTTWLRLSALERKIWRGIIIDCWFCYPFSHCCFNYVCLFGYARLQLRPYVRGRIWQRKSHEELGQDQNFKIILMAPRPMLRPDCTLGRQKPSWSRIFIRVRERNIWTQWIVKKKINKNDGCFRGILPSPVPSKLYSLIFPMCLSHRSSPGHSI